MGCASLRLNKLILLAAAAFTIPAPAQVYSLVKRFGGDPSGAYPTAPVIADTNGTLYGTTQAEFGTATIFRIQPDGSGFTVIRALTNAPQQGSNLNGGLVFVGDVLYGTAAYGGSANRGVIFRVNKSGTDFVVVKHFTGSDGAYPFSRLLCDGDTLYGTTVGGGNSNQGTLFKIKTDGTGFTVLRHFSGVDAQPYAGVVLGDNKLYGTCVGPSGLESGGVFSVSLDGTSFTMLKVFSPPFYNDRVGSSTNAEGAHPFGTLALADGVLYGTTKHAGPTANGTVFRINTDGTGFSVLKAFTEPDGVGCRAGVTVANGSLYGAAEFNGGPTYSGTVYKLSTNGTGFTVLKTLVYYNTGANPQAALLFSGGVLFGTAQNEGPGGRGVVFRINPNGGDFRVIKAFGQNEGINPYSGLIRVGNTLYGTTFAGGTGGNGTLYSVSPHNGDFQVLKNFDSSTGRPRGELAAAGSTLFGATDPGILFKLNTDNSSFTPLASLTGNTNSSIMPMVSVSGNSLFGITYMGGPSANGTIFRINTNGSGYVVLKNCTEAEGRLPHASPTVSGNVMYGTTTDGGSAHAGVAYRMSTDGSGYTLLRNFSASDGGALFGQLVLDGDNLYGTTIWGGAYQKGTVFRMKTNGTGFAVLKNFSAAGFYPAGLVETNSDGMSASTLTLHRGILYGVCESGGTIGLGTVFSLSTNGTGFTVLKTFTGSDGANPWGTLSVFGNGLFGTAHNGGGGGGVVFKIALGPSITSQPKGITNSCGDAATLSVTADGPAPLSYQWFRNGAIIPAATATAFSFVNGPGTAGEYFVTVSNGFSISTSAVASVDFADSTPPTIVSGPTNILLNASAECRALMPDLRDEIVATDCSGLVNVTQLPSPGLPLPVGPTSIQFTVSDPSGNTTNLAVLLTVVDAFPPTITHPPQDLTNAPGAVAAFTVEATACSPLSYQWLFNGAVIPGATNPALVINPLHIGHAGWYAAVVTGSFATITSPPALLIINQAPVVDASATQRHAISHDGSNATVVLDGSRSSDPEGGFLQYQWVLVGEPGQLATGAVATASLPIGTHSVRLDVTDGFSTSSEVIQIRVVTIIQALAELIDKVEKYTSPSQRLVANLRVAHCFVQSGRPSSGLHQVQVFQQKVRSQIQASDPDLAIIFHQSAQAIINALEVAAAASSHAGHQPIDLTSRLHRKADGTIRMEFSGTPGRTHVIAASSDLVDWQLIGVAKEQNEGEFEFDDVEANRLGARFYRIIIP